MKYILPALCLLGLSTLPVSAQRETNHWLFGHRAGLRFNDSVGVTFSGSNLHQSEGSAVISDPKTGQLLFYTDGRQIWNREHQVMANGSGLRGSATSTQSALIVPAPGQPGRYYVFTVKAFNDGPAAGLHYSVVDMKLNDGLGGVLAQTVNTPLATRTTEKLTAIPHENGQGYWVLAHAWNSDEFLITQITSQGVSPVKRQRIGTIHRAGKRVKSSEAMGYLKASPDGTRLASAVYGINRPFELYDFDAGTGTLSNYRSLGDFSNQYGVSFSSDNTKLYLSGLYAHDGSYQFDLTTPDYAVMTLTLQDTVQNTPAQSYLSGALQLGIDGKLYSAGLSPAKSNPKHGRMAVVGLPNAPGQACLPGYQSMDYDGQMPLLGLPNFIQSVFNKPAGAEAQEVSEGVMVYPNPVVQNRLVVEPLASGERIEGITVYDQAGRQVLHYDKPLSTRLAFDTSGWGAAGVYEVVLRKSHTTITRRIFKQ